jgi:phosphatidylserine decarboxylase
MAGVPMPMLAGEEGSAMGTQTSATVDQLVRGRVGPVAAHALLAEFARYPGPKSALVTGAEPGSPVLTAALDALGPQDRLTLVGESDRLTGYLPGAWFGQRVRVVPAVADADPVDAVVVAQPRTGTGEQVRAELDRLAKLLRPGGVLAVGVPATSVLAGEAGTELDRAQALHGIGVELVLRNLPPLRVHRLRYSPPDARLAEQIRPLDRTSSVALTEDLHLDANGVAAAALCLGSALLLRRTRLGRRVWLLPLLAAGGAAAFFRDPERRVPDDPDAVLAASDGRVLAVETVHDDRLGPAEYLRVAVFLSVLDVHINRAPVAGAVVDQFLVDGGYAAAMQPAAEHNVSAYTVLDTAHGRVAVAQRTGLIARRIVHRAPVGALLARGERFGLIRFGSRTDVYLPAGTADATVEPGDPVTGGETVIARWR